MADEGLDILEQDEKALASALVKVKVVPPDAIREFMRHKKGVLEAGKPYLGAVLVDLKFIDQSVLDQYVRENVEAHEGFINTLEKEGYLSPEQIAALQEKQKETGRDLITLISELNIMTKENYIRIFNKRTNTLRLGEWLVANKKVSQENLDAALFIRNITKLEDYLVHRNYCRKQVIDKVKEKLSGA